MTKYQRPPQAERPVQASAAEDLIFKDMEFRESLDGDYDIAIRKLSYDRAVKAGIEPATAAEMFGLTIS